MGAPKKVPRQRRQRGKPIEPLYRAIGVRVRRLRLRRRWTLTALAAAIGWDRANLCHVEQGRQRVMLHDLLRLAEALAVDVRELLA